MNKTLLAVALSFAAALPLAVQAQGTGPLTDLPALRGAATADRKTLVTSTLQLGEAEAKKFWPIHDAYQRSREASDRRRVRAIEGLIATDKPISDAYARNVATELLQADEAELKARRALHNQLMRALPAKKAAQYLQLESKLRAIQAYDIAGSVPLIK
jgi:Spy/CpxP family protein refolding chaperone